MNDLISRQAAIDILDAYQVMVENGEEKPYAWARLRMSELPSAQQEQTKMIKEIRKWINSGNRGSADYFIVDKIEEIINKYE